MEQNFKNINELSIKMLKSFSPILVSSNQRAINENKPFARSASVYQYDKQDCEAIMAKFQQA